MANMPNIPNIKVATLILLVLLVLLATVAIAMVLPSSWALAEEGGFRLSSNKAVSEITPKPPVKVKLKKLADGSDTWEITGTNVQNILDADSALRKYIKENSLKAR